MPDPELTKHLSEKQRLFCYYYVKNGNATKAAIKAGYVESCAHVSGSRLLRNDKIQKAINEMNEDARKAATVSVQYVLRKLSQLAEECSAKGGDTYNPTAANKSLELLGRHLGMFTDKIKVDGAEKLVKGILTEADAEIRRITETDTNTNYPKETAETERGNE